MQAIKKRPILFSTSMVQAILAGRKTMTRRVIKPQPIFDQDSGYVYSGNHKNMYKNDLQHKPWQTDFIELCPYGQPGDILWVRETYGIGNESGMTYYRANTNYPETICKWKPSIFMPYTVCRLFLRIVDVRVERLQNISEEDAVAEGIEPVPSFDSGAGLSGKQLYKNYLPHGYTEVLPIDSFQSLWQGINGEDSWQDNPWVWVISFERAQKPE